MGKERAAETEPDDVAAEIRRHRERLGLTLEAFAARIGVTLRAVQYWESGARKPGVGVLPMVRRMKARKG